MDTKQLTKEDLAGFTGTEPWYRHPVVKNTLYTDGIKYVAQKAGAYWLIDEITLPCLVRFFFIHSSVLKATKSSLNKIFSS